MVSGYVSAVRLLHQPRGDLFLCLCIRLAQLSTSGSSPPHCSCSARLWVRTSGRDSLEVEGVSTQTRLCQLSREHPPLPSAPDIITASGRGTQQFPAPWKEHVSCLGHLKGLHCYCWGPAGSPGSGVHELVPPLSPSLCWQVRYLAIPETL